MAREGLGKKPKGGGGAALAEKGVDFCGHLGYD